MLNESKHLTDTVSVSKYLCRDMLWYFFCDVKDKMGNIRIYQKILRDRVCLLLSLREEISSERKCPSRKGSEIINSSPNRARKREVNALLLNHINYSI